jgi:hypothetical protein
LTFDQLDSAIADLEAVLRDFEPRLLDARGAMGAVERFAKAKKLAEAGVALAGKRVDETKAYRDSGSKSAADWLATKTGSGVGAADRALGLGKSLSDLPATNEAFRAGEISEVQAHEIAGAASKDPSAEAELVRQAKSGISLKGLKDRCRGVRAGAEEDDEAWAQRLHDTRSLRRWVDPDAAACGNWRTTPDKGAEINAALDAEIELLYKEARVGGDAPDSRDALAVDALHALITRGPRKATSASLIIDGEVASDGTIAIGQRCEIVGIGQIPVTIARRMLADAKVRAVPANGSLLPEYSTDTRYYPQWMRDWLEQNYSVCGQPGCDADFVLQIDHVVALQDGGFTEIDNLWRLCPHHHDLKTNHGWKVVGATHDWKLVPPGGLDPP